MRFVCKSVLSLLFDYVKCTHRWWKKSMKVTIPQLVSVGCSTRSLL